MGFFLDHWYGRLSVGKAVWQSGMVALLVCLPISLLDTYTFFAINHIHGFEDLVNRAQDGNMEFALPPFFMRALEEMTDCASLVWWSVGTWRACRNPNAKGAVENYWFLKFSIIATGLYEAYDFYDFVKSAVSG